jgi:excisionase family DNA binding protein
MAIATETPVSELLLRPRDAAKALGLSERTLWELTRQGRIKAIKPTDRAVRYAVADLERFVEEARQ